MIDLYVYYKVREAHAAALAPLVLALQAKSGVPGAVLKRRPGSKDGFQTWMEVYPGVPEDFPVQLEEAAAAGGCGALVEGPRRAEVFVDMSTEPSREATPCA